MPSTGDGLKLPLIDNTPQELISQIQVMRRNPADFYLRRRGACSLGCDRKGERTSYQFGHANSPEAGTWCAVHGWLSFDSVALSPTERLTASEIEDRKLEQKRKRKKAGSDNDS